jgi:hypothetical protein
LSFTHGRWGPAKRILGGLGSPQCSSATLCAAVRATGGVATFDGSRWTAIGHLVEAIASVSCPTRRFCIAVALDGGIVAFNGRSWKSLVGASEPGAFTQADCLSPAFCMIFGGYGDTGILQHGMLATQHIAGADPGYDYPDYVTGACASRALCVAVARLPAQMKLMPGPAGLFVFDGHAWN